ncbi:MAG TPA: two-component system response regulator, partial [Nostoc sp.]|nr:two-component system response regulator [Nostoc sp.]
IPVILLTAKIQASDRRRYTQMGMISAIAKPFNPLELATEVAIALGWIEEAK